MNIIYYLMPLALLLGGGFALSFIVAAIKGQYDDLETPARRMLLDDDQITRQDGHTEESNIELSHPNGQRTVR